VDVAVGRLSGAWIRQVLAEVYPNGVVRRALLDHFAVLLVSNRSSRGAKGRLARRLYGTLMKLQRRGLLVMEDGIVRPLVAPRKAGIDQAPELGPVLAKQLFRALLAEDGQGDGHTAANLREARWDFISGAVEGGWTLPQAASALGLSPLQATGILDLRRVGKEKIHEI
jgi:hypothetical protein